MHSIAITLVNDPRLAAFVGVALGAFLCLAGISKLLDWGGFRRAVDNYQLLSPFFAKGVAKGLPLIEIGVGCFIISGLWRRFALDAAGRCVSTTLRHSVVEFSEQWRLSFVVC